MKRDNFRLSVDFNYPNLEDFVIDFNNMGGNINIDILKFHMEYPEQIDTGWLNAYGLFFQNKFRQELILANTVINDKYKYN